jgi:hypothetical protein
MASESRLRDKEREEIYVIPTLLLQHDLDFRKPFRPFSIRPMVPGVRNDYDRLQFLSFAARVRYGRASGCYVGEGYGIVRSSGPWPSTC